MTNHIIEAVSLDIEGCVTGRGARREAWSIRRMTYLASILLSVRNEMGIRSFLNSGRPQPYVEAVLQALGLVVFSTPSVFENGSGLYFPDTRAFKRNPNITEEKFLAFQEVKKALEKITAELGGVRELGKEFSFSTNPPDGMVITEYFNLFQEPLKQSEAGEAVEANHSQSALDFTIKGVNKQTGLEFWCQETGIKLEQLAAIGDSRGDLSVLKIVGLPMCPSNAIDEVREMVKARKGFISYYQSNLGVIDCVAFLAKKNPLIQNTKDKIIMDCLLHSPTELY